MLNKLLLSATVAYRNIIIMTSLMGAMTSQITSLMIVFTQPFIQAKIKESSASLAFVREFTGHRWIPRIKGQ